MELDAACDRYGIDYLYHFTHLANMPSIREHDLLPHDEAHRHRLVVEDISDKEVQDRRADRKAFGRPLHAYVPLYFNPRNPMLYVRKAVQNDIVILCLDRKLLARDGAVFSDGNAANDATRFFNDLKRLNDLDWNCIRAQYWRDFDDGKRKRCAEILIPDAVPFDAIERICVRTESTLRRFDELHPELSPVGITPEKYFDD